MLLAAVSIGTLPAAQSLCLLVCATAYARSRSRTMVHESNARRTHCLTCSYSGAEARAAGHLPCPRHGRATGRAAHGVPDPNGEVLYSFAGAEWLAVHWRSVRPQLTSPQAPQPTPTLASTDLVFIVPGRRVVVARRGAQQAGGCSSVGHGVSWWFCDVLCYAVDVLWCPDTCARAITVCAENHRQQSWPKPSSHQ